MMTNEDAIAVSVGGAQHDYEPMREALNEIAGLLRTVGDDLESIGLVSNKLEIALTRITELVPEMGE